MSFKSEHFAEAVQARSPGLWFECHPENHMVAGGPRLAMLEAMRAQHPLSLHGVSLSLAGHEAPDHDHLQRLVNLVRRLEPALVSEHLAWSRMGEHHAPDLLPFPRTQEALRRIAAHVSQLQDRLQRRVAIENPSHYLHVEGHEWNEVDFLHELSRRTGCGLLVDVNNVFVSAHNIGIDARDWLDRLDAQVVLEIHLAGHHPDPTLGTSLLIDGHDAPIDEAVWALYDTLVARIGPRPTLIERDGNLPAFEVLMAERMRAQAVLNRAPAHQEVAA